MRVFLDANILFSAAKTDGAVRLLLNLLLKAGHECCVDGYVTEEARRNLDAKAPGGLAALDALLPHLRQEAAQHADAALEATLPLPEKDRPVLAAAIRHGCAALVTGDRSHFGLLYGKTIRGVAIHSPRSLAEALLK
jgi:predicted nucleic acid-binding protein